MISKNIEDLCKDYVNIENYDKAVKDSRIWHCHHRREILKNEYGKVIDILTPKELQDANQYWHVSASDLIFLSTSEHNKLHKDAYKKLQEYRDTLADQQILEEMYDFYRNKCKPEEQYYKDKFLTAYSNYFSIAPDVAEHRCVKFENMYELMFITDHYKK